ncbi:MAG: hypothetical protein FJW21_05015 [Acidimicrobiia bacterium]|nr:hypothetical protein [Acidimicrobiia bacterium]MBM4052986.1 hypothetical protein [Planctomycetota bacterium]
MQPGASRPFSARVLVLYSLALLTTGFLMGGGTLPGVATVHGLAVRAADRLAAEYRGARRDASAWWSRRTNDAVVPAPLNVDGARVVLTIPDEGVLRLEDQRSKSLAAGTLQADQWVEAQMSFDGRTHLVRLRLKGTRSDHWGEFPSWRVEVRDGTSIYGMRRFSLQHPAQRNYLDEWYFHQLLRHYGLLGQTYDFVALTVNGRPMPTYALEEVADSWYLERERLTPGLVVELNHTDSARYEVTVVNPKRVAEDPRLAAQFETVKTLVARLPRTPSRAVAAGFNYADVFDLEKMAKFYAVLDMTGQEHAAYVTNSKYYFNPFTSRLEPIGYDNGTIENIVQPFGTRRAYWEDATQGEYLHDAMLLNPAFFAAYRSAVDEITDKAVLDRFIDRVRPEAAVRLAHLQEDLPGHDPAIVQELYGNRVAIRRLLRIDDRVTAAFESSDVERREVALRVASEARLSLEVDALLLNGRVVAKANVDAPVVGADEGVVVAFTLRAGLTVGAIADPGVRRLELRYRDYGVTRWRTAAVSFPRLDDRARTIGNVRSFAFLEVDEAAKVILVRPGQWTLTESLVIPAGYRVVGSGAIDIRLRRFAKIVSFSPLELTGTAEVPVKISSDDGTGQGVVVMDAKALSTLTHVTFDGLSNPRDLDWDLTGAVTFYRSPLKLNYARFHNNRSEDSLHTVNTAVEGEFVYFVNAPSDGWDADFCNLQVTYANFLGMGGDGFDLSGSSGRLAEVDVDGAGDKGISVGESTNITLHAITVHNADVGIASKDSSVAIVTNLLVGQTHIGVAIYIKKGEYGPAKAYVTNVTFERVTREYYVQLANELNVDGATRHDLDFERTAYERPPT